MEINNNILVEQDREINRLSRYLLNNNMPNSLILVGDKGVGLKDTAMKMASCLVNGEINQTSDSAKESLKQCQNYNSSYLLLIEKIWLEDKKRFKNKIYREDLSYIHDFFATKDGNSQKRVCIINSIDDLSNDAINSLLKIIEEPNLNSHFIIINHNQKYLIPTIKSRSQIIKFKSTNKNDFFKLMKNEYFHLQNEEIEKLFTLSKGSFDFSRKYLDYNFREMEEHLENILIEPKNIKPNTANHYINFVRSNINNNDEMETFLKFIAFKINKLSIKACSDNNKYLLDRLVKNYYAILKIKSKYLTFNLNFDHAIIAYFYLLKNG